MHVAISVPKRINGVAITSGGADFCTFHLGVLSVYILQNIGMQLGMVECCVEDTPLGLGAALYGDSAQRLVPLVIGFSPHVVEVDGRLFGC